MKQLLLKIIALIPIPVIVLLVLWAGKRPLPMPHQIVQSEIDNKPAEKLPSILGLDWKRIDTTKHYDRETLFERIDGAAPAYVKVGFVQLFSADYKKQTQTVTIDLYDMGLAINAEKIYKSEKDPSYKELQLGSDGYLASGMLSFWYKKYFAKLIAYKAGDSVDKALMELGIALFRTMNNESN